jgi:hypothetical protein
LIDETYEAAWLDPANMASQRAAESSLKGSELSLIFSLSISELPRDCFTRESVARQRFC